MICRLLHRSKRKILVKFRQLVSYFPVDFSKNLVFFLYSNSLFQIVSFVDLTMFVIEFHDFLSFLLNLSKYSETLKKIVKILKFDGLHLGMYGYGP